jgi:hypothetical protein
LTDPIQPDRVADMRRFVWNQIVFSLGRSHEHNAPDAGRIKSAIRVLFVNEARPFRLGHDAPLPPTEPRNWGPGCKKRPAACYDGPQGLKQADVEGWQRQAVERNSTSVSGNWSIRRAGLERAFLSRLENGRSDLTLSSLEKLADAFGLTISELTKGL